MGPKHVYRMGTGQAALRSDVDREAYIAAVEKRGSQLPVDRWFQDNTREPIRDETLRDGLVRTGAVSVMARALFRSTPPRQVLALMIFLAAFVSAWISNTALCALFIPIIIEVAREKGILPSRLLLPLSYFIIIGGSSTVIGTAWVWARNGAEPPACDQMKRMSAKRAASPPNVTPTIARVVSVPYSMLPGAAP